MKGNNNIEIVYEEGSKPLQMETGKLKTGHFSFAQFVMEETQEEKNDVETTTN